LPAMGFSTEYFPLELSNGPGAVWKYYVHSTRKKGQRKTNIKYRKMVMDDDKLYITDHSADYQETYKETINIDGDQWKVLSTSNYNYRGDLDSLRTTMHYRIGDKVVFLDWKNQEATLERSISNDEWNNDLVESHNEVRDSVVNDQKIKTFYGNLISTFSESGDTSITRYDWRREFSPGLGMIAQHVKTDGVTYEWQLDEIISLGEFEKRADHGTHRVGYIDPEQSLSDDTNFKTCYHISRINDYYNDDRAQHKGGKGGLWEMLEKKLDKSLLKDQEGYLSYHFVVNCEGKAGRFVTEEADLEYNRTKFSDGLRNHLLQILIEEDQWKNLTVNGESRDAYVYVTFKIEDDEIIEILP